MNVTTPSRSYAWARNLSPAMGVVMLLIGVVFVRALFDIMYHSTSESLGLVITFFAFKTIVFLILPGLGYLFFTFFMRPWRMWPMAVLLALSELQVVAGALTLWTRQWDQQMSGWFGWLWIVYTTVPAILVVLLWIAMRELADTRRGQAH